ncbi:MAG: Holliday junction resolvase RuvX [Cryomorphaceae bacterium]|jgi:putative Holliday junction resolvase|nr:Holliday junction resolvase RuvX [Cryomorphaceae bacterium]
MGKAIAIDFGLKRSGIAITDDLKLFAFPHETVESQGLMGYLEAIVPKELVDTIVLGEPKRMDNSDTHITENVRLLYEALVLKFAELNVVLMDERFTSKMAVQAMIAGGMKKKDRQVKGNIDKISAAIVLQSYLSANNH